MPRRDVAAVAAGVVKVPPNELDKRLARLEASVSTTQRNAKRWRKAFWCAVTGLVVAAGAAGAAISSTTNQFSAIFGEINTYDENSFVTSNTGTDVAPVTLAVQGDTSGVAVEMVDVLGGANTALTSGNWFYTATVKEVAAATIGSGTFKVELFVDGASKGALYLKQATADAAAIEGVTLKWDLGPTLDSQAAYVIKIIQA